MHRYFCFRVRLFAHSHTRHDPEEVDELYAKFAASEGFSFVPFDLVRSPLAVRFAAKAKFQYLKSIRREQSQDFLAYLSLLVTIQSIIPSPIAYSKLPHASNRTERT
jgi:hypothetical protein